MRICWTSFICKINSTHIFIILSIYFSMHRYCTFDELTHQKCSYFSQACGLNVLCDHNSWTYFSLCSSAMWENKQVKKNLFFSKFENVIVEKNFFALYLKLAITFWNITPCFSKFILNGTLLITGSLSFINYYFIFCFHA